MIEGADALQHVRHLVAEMKQPDINVKEIANAAKHVEACWISDAKTLVDLLRTDAGVATAKRLRLLIAQLREILENDPKLQVHWSDTATMLADALTKAEADGGFLLDALESGRWDHRSTEATLAAKAKLREQRQRRKKTARSSAADAQDGSEPIGQTVEDG